MERPVPLRCACGPGNALVPWTWSIYLRVVGKTRAEPRGLVGTCGQLSPCLAVIWSNLVPCKWKMRNFNLEVSLQCYGLSDPVAQKVSAQRAELPPAPVFIISSIWFIRFSASLRRGLLLCVLFAFVSSQVTGNISEDRNQNEKPPYVYLPVTQVEILFIYLLVSSLCSLNKTYSPSSALILLKYLLLRKTQSTAEKQQLAPCSGHTLSISVCVWCHQPSHKAQFGFLENKVSGNGKGRVDHWICCENSFLARDV